MYLYNTTFAVDTSLEEDVIRWIKNEFIPSAVEDEYFLSDSGRAPAALRVVGGEPGVSSIAVHLYCESIVDIKDWYADRGARLFNDVIERWDGKVVFFSTTLEILYGC